MTFSARRVSWVSLFLRPTVRKLANECWKKVKIDHVVSKLDFTVVVGAFAYLHRHERWTDCFTLRNVPAAAPHGALNYTYWFLRALGVTLPTGSGSSGYRQWSTDTLSDVLLSTNVTLISFFLALTSFYLLIIGVEGHFCTWYNVMTYKQRVELLWTSDQLIAETSTWQHITLTRDR